MKKILFVIAVVSSMIGASCSASQESYKTGRDPQFHGGYRDVEYRNNHGYPGR